MNKILVRIHFALEAIWSSLYPARARQATGTRARGLVQLSGGYVNKGEP